MGGALVAYDTVAARSIEASRADLEPHVTHARDVISGTQRGNWGSQGGAHLKEREDGGLVEDPRVARRYWSAAIASAAYARMLSSTLAG